MSKRRSVGQTGAEHHAEMKVTNVPRIIMKSSHYRAALGALILAMSFAFGACSGNNSGGGEEDENLCADFVCARGVCNTQTGACQNAILCGGDSNQCLEGFSCVDNACAPDVACNADGSCDRGVCTQGACISPESCTANQECAQGEYCEEGSCAEDPCAVEDACPRGLCEPGETGSATCFNPDMCEEDADCLVDYKCVEGTCANEATFCANNPCDRGVCDFEALGCKDAQDCTGGGDVSGADADQQCLEGNYCDGGTCVANQCDENMVMCDRGVCTRETGECANADPCTALEECVDGALCITDTCTERQIAEDAVDCPGNQVKEYDEQSLEVVCANNPDGCAAAIDCVGGDVCTDGTCAAPGMCAPDALEPNETRDARRRHPDRIDDGQ